MSEKTVSHYNIAKALAQQHGLNHAKTPDKPSAFPKLEAGFWLKTGLVPWRFTKGHWQIACANVQDYYKNFRDLHQICGDFSLVLASPTQIRNQTLQLFASHLLEQAETGLPSHQSCRSLKLKLPYLIALCCVVTGVMLRSELTAILSLFHIFLGVALASLSLSTILKITIFIGALGQKPASAMPSERPQVLPRVTVLIPLLEEPRILHHLLYHLQRLDYPRTHLEVMLILEDGDVETQTALLAAKLPSWCCVITVPKGRVKTKPRALNFALGFSRGDIIGVLDAEDAPEKDQLLKVANQFALADPRLVCLQGRLDFYNAHRNWLTRCFALEYAAWFHVILPGLARLGFALPLGGTSMYIRRSALIDLKGWDAFNVTEDADLGLHLSRAGLRCALLDSKTFEEATKTPLTWIKQRSRWQKGYFMTYWCHNRS
ncbi:MAG: glycosyltransferase, partial [Paracoccaceae bacterium]